MSESSNSVLVEARGLTKIYVTPATRVTVFEELSWRVPRGRLVAVIGPSGAGKSTLLRTVGINAALALADASVTLEPRSPR